MFPERKDQSRSDSLIDARLRITAEDVFGAAMFHVRGSDGDVHRDGRGQFDALILVRRTSEVSDMMCASSSILRLLGPKPGAYFEHWTSQFGIRRSYNLRSRPGRSLYS